MKAAARLASLRFLTHHRGHTTQGPLRRAGSSEQSREVSVTEREAKLGCKGGDAQDQDGRSSARAVSRAPLALSAGVPRVWTASLAYRDRYVVRESSHVMQMLASFSQTVCRETWPLQGSGLPRPRLLLLFGILYLFCSGLLLQNCRDSLCRLCGFFRREVDVMLPKAGVVVGMKRTEMGWQSQNGRRVDLWASPFPRVRCRFGAFIRLSGGCQSLQLTPPDMSG